MTFDEILDQAIEILQRRKRLSYRALKRQFNLDDEYLEDLKLELIEIQQVAVDQNGNMLVWTGEIGTQPKLSSTPPAQADVAKQNQPTQAECSPSQSPTPDAERRQLTVMFCDLADSTKLSGQLDPEDLREVIRAYQATSAEVIERYDGYIAQHLGDGLMVYFGWPQAHEDDAQRAVHAGLGILEALRGLNDFLEQEKSLRLAVRIGIHTGLVVVGEIGQGASQEHLALGETPNIASRIEGVAEPNAVAISDDTYQLVQGYFACEELGLHTLKGVDESQQVYHVVSASGAQNRLDVGVTRGLTPLVGREQETGLLVERWNQVKDGQGQVVLLSGEAGIGKSRLTQVLKEHVAGEAHTRLECRSSPYYQNTALYPITDLLQRTLQWQQEDTPDDKLVKLEQTLGQYRLPLEETVPLFASLLSLPLSDDRYPSLEWAPQRQRQKTLESTVTMLLELAERQPVLFILEDLHWTDPTTLELLGLLVDQAPTASLLTLLTCRPEFEPPWGLRSHLTPIALNRFTRPQIESMVERVSEGKTLPTEVLQHLVEKTDGVPLYVEEMTKAILEAPQLQESNGHYELIGPLDSMAIPTTLQDSLMARLDRLETAKGIAQLGATIGRQFSYDILQAVSALDEATLARALNRLIEAELVYHRGLPPQATYTFKHALIQDAAYQSLLKSTRQQYHQRIAQALEAEFPAAAEAQPELLAHHFTEAGLNKQAILYWQRAGQQAIERSANVEAIAHLNKGLELLGTFPETPESIQQELDTLIAIGPALMAIKGRPAPEVSQVYTRAHALCQQVGETPQLFTVLWGLWRYHLNRAAMQLTREIGEQVLILAQRQNDPNHVMLAHQSMGTSLMYMGDFTPARVHLERAIALCDLDAQRALALDYGTAPVVFCRAQLLQALWYLGYPDQALQRSVEACRLARELHHPHSMAQALHFEARVRHMRRDSRMALERAETALAFDAEHGLTFWLMQTSTLRDMAQAAQKQDMACAAQLLQSVTAILAMGQDLVRPTSLTHLAEAYGREGQVDVGLDQIEEALTATEEGGVRFYEAESYRIKGELLLKRSSDNQSQAETCFYKALEVSRQQQAKSWELRAATSLARLWQSQGKRQDAYDQLAPVYGWFTEGFDTADLKEAKALLEALG